MASQFPPSVQIDSPLAPKPTTNETIASSPGAALRSKNALHERTSTLSSPPALTATPPPITLSSSNPAEGYIRQQGNYSATRSGRPRRPSAQVICAGSPSETISASASRNPSFRSRSYLSTDSGTWSGSSSGYLTPPMFQGDEESPPYKPRRESSGSLTMMKKSERAYTFPDDKDMPKKLKKRHRSRSRHRCGRRTVRFHEHQDQSNWRLAGCQVVPTAPRGQKDMYEDFDGQHTRPKLRDTETSGQISSTSRKIDTHVGLERRWSSVEVGARQIISELTASSEPTTSNEFAGPAPQRSLALPSPGPRVRRSSKFTREAMDNDIVRTVRERLTLRKIPSSLQLKTPALITLRRASEVSSQAEAFTTPDTTFKSSNASKSSPPFNRLQNVLCDRERQLSAAYLITSKDIDSITALIEANIRRQYEAQPCERNSTSQSSTNNEASNPTSTGDLLPQSHPDVALLVAKAENRSNQSQDDQVQLLLGKKKFIDIAHKHSQHSVHEVIWQGDNVSPQSIDSAVEDDELKQPSDSECSPDASRNMIKHHQYKTGSNHKRTTKRPSNDLVLAATSPDSEFIVSDSNLNRSNSRGPSLGDLTSFPPLSSAKSTEWCVPLPETVTTPPHDTSHSLYDIGLDANSGPLSSSSRTITPPISSSNLRNEIFKPQFPVHPSSGSIKFDPVFDMRKRSFFKADSSSNPISPDNAMDYTQSNYVRKKGTAKDHPDAAPRTGDLGRVGSAIGAHGHARRPSPAGLGSKAKRARTFDNVPKGERDLPSSMWRPRFFDPAALIKARSPSQPTADTVGIYAQLTGSQTANTSRHTWLRNEARRQPHECDDCLNDPRAHPSVD